MSILPSISTNGPSVSATLKYVLAIRSAVMDLNFVNSDLQSFIVIGPSL